MALSLTSTMVGTGNALYYTDAWMNTMEQHMRYLREHPDTTVIDIDPHDALKYEGDLWSLLREQAIPLEYTWLIARMNDLASPSANDATLRHLLVPSMTIINELRAIFQTLYKKLN